MNCMSLIHNEMQLNSWNQAYNSCYRIKYPLFSLIFQIQTEATEELKTNEKYGHFLRAKSC